MSKFPWWHKKEPDSDSNITKDINLTTKPPRAVKPFDLDLLCPWEMAPKQNAVIRNMFKQDMNSRILHDYPNTQMICRPLLASDVGLAEWKVPQLSAYHKQLWIEHTVSELQNICIYKIIKFGKHSFVGGRVEIMMNNAVKSIFELDKLDIIPEIIKEMTKDIGEEADLKKWLDYIRLIGLEAYMLSGIVCSPDSNLTINITSTTNCEESKLMLGGYVFEPEGKNIQI